MSIKDTIEHLKEEVKNCQNQIQECIDDVNRGMELLNQEESRLSDIMGSLILLEKQINES